MYTLVHSSLCILWSDKTYTTQFATAGPTRYTYLHIYWRISTYLQNIYSYWHLWIREPGCCHSEYYHSYLEHRALEHGPGELLYISQLLNRYFLQYMIIENIDEWIICNVTVNVVDQMSSQLDVSCQSQIFIQSTMFMPQVANSQDHCVLRRNMTLYKTYTIICTLNPYRHIVNQW